MALITDGYTLFSFANTIGYKGQYSGSFGSQDFLSFFVGATYVTPSPIVNEDAIAKLTTGFNIYYKMEGYNTSTQQYENWHSMGAPLLVPPSGHTLTNISVVASWIDR